MAKTITGIRTMNQDGSWGNEVPFEVTAENVFVESKSKNLEEALKTVSSAQYVRTTINASGVEFTQGWLLYADTNADLEQTAGAPVVPKTTEEYIVIGNGIHGGEDYIWDETISKFVKVGNAGITVKSPVSLPVATTYRYDGEQKETNIESTALYTVSGTTIGTEVGTYELTLSIIDPDTYAWSDGASSVRTVEWEIKRGQKIKPTAQTNTLRFNGDVLSAEFNGDAGTTGVSVTGNTGINVGNNYEATFFLDTTHYEWTDGSDDDVVVGWEILKGQLVKPTKTGTDPYTYSGTEFTLAVTNGDNININIKNTSDDIHQTNAGNYETVYEISNKDNYEWEDGTQTDVILYWSINKANPSITFEENESAVSSVTFGTNEGSTARSFTVNAGGSTGSVTISSAPSATYVTYDYTDGVITLTPTEESGNTALTVTISEDDNYNSGTATLSIVCNYKPELVTWSAGTDAQIKDMVDAYYNGVLTLAEIKSVWKVGDTRKVSLSAMSATGVGESHRAQDVYMAILDFEHDNLASPVNGKSKALITVQQKDCLRDASVTDTTGSSNTEHGYMNSSNTNSGGWTNCARRTWCNNVYYAALPSGFKGLVREITHQTTQGNQSTALRDDTDKCFLLSEWEIFGAKTYAAAQEGTQYEYYKTAANRYKLPKWSSSSVSDAWWERSPYGSNATYFCAVNNAGNAYYYNASRAYGLAPACCL